MLVNQNLKNISLFSSDNYHIIPLKKTFSLLHPFEKQITSKSFEKVKTENKVSIILIVNKSFN